MFVLNFKSKFRWKDCQSLLNIFAAQLTWRLMIHQFGSVLINKSTIPQAKREEMWECNLFLVSPHCICIIFRSYLFYCILLKRTSCWTYSHKTFLCRAQKRGNLKSATEQINTDVSVQFHLPPFLCTNFAKDNRKLLADKCFLCVIINRCSQHMSKKALTDTYMLMSV